MNWKTTKLKKLTKALMSIKKEVDMQNFLRDLCTLEELDELSNRWKAAELLNKGLPYREVATKTGMSTTTVTRIAHWMKHGEGGYKKILKK
ncbi:MAG: DNA-binding transcriptional regulator [Candidatus Magasanikbacteria bacterium]|jgi:TrpR-related protein YerC/YecD|nr:DNA-binding transcriptional regulator [Candidatus Magasanikbacteria bacterium]MBT4314871.1 DNA-binding transcriptional regulator [Candidatus Magasanikbacteria bacterium]MBT4546742.1 DNA-binding transcriptional regulator [Candidatus Magasanikbacteria bacterium]MBT6819649.1 DNA-binding transcriptional regulator [Candidatus Magasanikbacteria bacterium]